MMTYKFGCEVLPSTVTWQGYSQGERSRLPVVHGMGGMHRMENNARAAEARDQ